MQGLKCRIWGLLRGYGAGFMKLGCTTTAVSGVWGVGCGVQGLGFEVQGPGSRIWILGSRVEDLGPGVEG